MEGLKTCMKYVLWLSILILVGVFITDWFFSPNHDLLNDTLVGVLIGFPGGSFSTLLAFFTTDKVEELINKKENKGA